VSVEIFFRGVCLFRRKGAQGASGYDALQSVYVPNAETLSTSDVIADQTPIVRHFSRMVVLDANNRVVARHNLLRSRVRIADAFAGDCLLNPSFQSVPNLGEVFEGHPLTFVPETHGTMATVIHVAGGALSAMATLNDGWVGPREAMTLAARPAASQSGASPASGRPGIASLVSWRSSSPTASVEVAELSADGGMVRCSFALDATQPRAYIYNFDVEWPSIPMLGGTESFDPPKVNAQEQVVDDDFKLLYRLVSPESVSALLDKSPGGKLPAPLLLSQPASGLLGRNPGSSGCYPGRA